RLVGAYLADWELAGYNGPKFDYSKVTHVFYAFANITENGNLTLPVNFNQAIVDDIHASNARAILSIGGWGTTPFSPVFASSTSRAIFVADVLSVLIARGFDGVDIDWEFPNRAGGGQATDAGDSANLLATLGDLKSALGSTFSVSATAPIFGFTGATQGLWLSDLSAFASALDFLTVMAYDLNGSWETYTGPNAPLQANSANNGGSIVEAINFFAGANFPLNQLVLGTP
ncbi:glycoside hydrolase superfamily, partial [Obelidium mucronatum]